MKEDLFAAVDRFISDRFAAEDPALERTVERMREAGLPEIEITPSQGKLLQMLAALAGARRILEIGTLGGYSAIWLARALSEDGELISLELDPHHADIARENIREAGLSDRVTVRTGAALTALREMIDGGERPFDLIFIDADKPLYLQYFQLALGLSRPGTLIVADNVVREGKILDPDPQDEKVEGVQRLLNHLANTDSATTTVLQTMGQKGHDGMSLSLAK
jgi:predicted O-methyltransferase YrrM